MHLEVGHGLMNSQTEACSSSATGSEVTCKDSLSEWLNISCLAGSVVAGSKVVYKHRQPFASSCQQISK
jgi:hypothetical protein